MVVAVVVDTLDCLQVVVVVAVVAVMVDTLDCLQSLVVIVDTLDHLHVVVVDDTLDCLQLLVVIVNTLDCLQVERLDRLHYPHMMAVAFLLIVFEIYAIHYLAEHFYEQL